MKKLHFFCFWSYQRDWTIPLKAPELMTARISNEYEFLEDNISVNSNDITSEGEYHLEE